MGRVAIRELTRKSLPEALVGAIATRSDGERLPAGSKKRLTTLLATTEAQDALFDQSDAGTQTLAKLIVTNVLQPEAPDASQADLSAYSNRLAGLLVAELLGVLNLGPAFATIGYKLRHMDSSMTAGFANLRSKIEVTEHVGRGGGSREVADITDRIVHTPAVNGLAILSAYDLAPDELAEMCNEINGFAELLATIPVAPRSVLALIVARGEALDPLGLYMGHSSRPWTPGFQIAMSVLETVASCSDRELRAHVEVLEHFDLLKTDLEPFDGPPSYIVGTPAIEWTLLRDIRDFDASDGEQIRRMLCDLDFTALDL